MGVDEGEAAFGEVGCYVRDVGSVVLDLDADGEHADGGWAGDAAFVAVAVGICGLEEVLSGGACGDATEGGEEVSVAVLRG